MCGSARLRSRFGTCLYLTNTFDTNSLSIRRTRKILSLLWPFVCPPFTRCVCTWRTAETYLQLWLFFIISSFPRTVEAPRYGQQNFCGLYGSKNRIRWFYRAYCRQLASRGYKCKETNSCPRNIHLILHRLPFFSMQTLRILRYPESSRLRTVQMRHSVMRTPTQVTPTRTVKVLAYL